MSVTLSSLLPDKIAPCTAAPYATASSGLILLFNCLPLKKLVNCSWILGILVEPPTNTISSISFLLTFASHNTFSTGSKVFLNNSLHNDSNLALLIDVL